MDRTRSWSRHRPANTDQPRSPSPSTSTPRDSTTSVSSRGRPLSRPPPSHRNSLSRSSSAASSTRSRSLPSSPARRPHQNHQHERHHRHSHSHEHHHGLFKTSAGLIAGIGLATVLAHKVWPKDDDERESHASRSKHHHHHHHHNNHHTASDSHHRRTSDVSPSARSRDDVIYVEESGPYRRADARRMSLDPRAFDRMAGRGRTSARPLPYPETPYPGEKFYEPRGLRASFSGPLPVSR